MRCSFGRVNVAQHAGLGLINEGGELGHLGPDLVGHRAPLGAGGFGCVLREGVGDDGRDNAAALLSGMGKDVPHEVHRGAVE